MENELHYCNNCKKETEHKTSALIDKIVCTRLVGCPDDLQPEEYESEEQIGINYECTICNEKWYELF